MVPKLKVLYEDDEIVVMKAPHDDELVELVYEFIAEKKRPVTWKELREAFSGIAGEDRLRKALHVLREQGRIVELRGGRYATPDTPGALEEYREIQRRRLMREMGSVEYTLRRYRVAAEDLSN